MPLQSRQVVERIDSVEFAGVNQTHEQVAYLRAVQRPIKQRILAMQHGPLQGPFAKIMPPPGLCRVLPLLTQPAWFLTIPDAA